MSYLFKNNFSLKLLISNLKQYIITLAYGINSFQHSCLWGYINLIIWFLRLWSCFKYRKRMISFNRDTSTKNFRRRFETEGGNRKFVKKLLTKTTKLRNQKKSVLKQSNYNNWYFCSFVKGVFLQIFLWKFCKMYVQIFISLLFER